MTVTVHTVSFSCAEGYIFLSETAAVLPGCKGRIIPLQAWTGPEGSRKLRFLDFKTIST